MNTPAQREITYLNCHSHHKPRIEGECVVRNAYLSLNQAQITGLGYRVSVGLHPWHIGRNEPNAVAAYLSEIAGLEQVVAIGETGLDRSIHIPMREQELYFRLHLEVASSTQKPLIIHAVRSYYDFIPYLKKHNLCFIFHQFNGNPEEAKALLKYNVRLSFGKNLFSPTGAELFKQLPADAFLLETDDANHLHIADVYARAAEIRETKPDVFATQVADNMKHAGISLV